MADDRLGSGPRRGDELGDDLALAEPRDVRSELQVLVVVSSMSTASSPNDRPETRRPGRRPPNGDGALRSSTVPTR